MALTSLAKEILDSEDEFTIHTKTGKKFTRNEIMVSKSISLKLSSDGLISYNEAVDKLKNYYNDLKQDGIIDEY